MVTTDFVDYSLKKLLLICKTPDQPNDNSVYISVNSYRPFNKVKKSNTRHNKIFDNEIKEWQNKLIWTNFDGKLNCSLTTENDRKQGKNENYAI